MGLFSRKKKASAEQAAASALAQQNAVRQQAAAAASAAAAERKAREDAEKRREDNLVTDISAKRTEMNQMLGAIDDFQKQANAGLGRLKAARNANRKAEASVHLRSVQRLQQRIKQYEGRIARIQEQLATLEDTAFQRHGLESNKKYIENMKQGQVDNEEVADVLQDMRETMDKVNDVNLTITADQNLHGTAVDEADMDDEIERLAAEFGEPVPDDTTQNIPAVPSNVPDMPRGAQTPSGMPAATITTPIDKEEEEIRRLEASMLS